jgi:GNAT superfamily N-acetyltransferase
MTLRIVPLQDQHLEGAAHLVAVRHRLARQQVPILPGRFENPDRVLPPLQRLASQSEGVAALEGDRLVGFLLGMVLSEFKGLRSIYVPEWSHAVVGDRRRRVYEEMYAAAAARWVANECLLHAITLLADDQEAFEAWNWMTFGLLVVDAVRDLTPVAEPLPEVDIWRAGPEDVETAMAFDRALSEYLLEPPTFLLGSEPMDRTEHAAWLEDTERALWVASHRGEPVGVIGLQPSNPTAAATPQDDASVCITRAFTKPSARGQEIGSALLARAIEWARTAGYVRCAVDFESANVLGRRFWLRHFEPVCLSLMRVVDPGHLLE